MDPYQESYIAPYKTETLEGTSGSEVTDGSTTAPENTNHYFNSNTAMGTVVMNESNMMTWMIIMSLSVIALAWMLFMLRRKKERR
jgi:hypothetical protein